MVALLTVTLWTSVFLLRQNYVVAVECEGMNIKYESEALLALSNCTSILGSLVIANINDFPRPYDLRKPTNDYVFPNLM